MQSVGTGQSSPSCPLKRCHNLLQTCQRQKRASVNLVEFGRLELSWNTREKSYSAHFCKFLSAFGQPRFIWISCQKRLSTRFSDSKTFSPNHNKESSSFSHGGLFLLLLVLKIGVKGRRNLKAIKTFPWWMVRNAEGYFSRGELTVSRHLDH